MKQTVLISLALVLGVICGSYISPLLAQSRTSDTTQTTCLVREASNAVCSGKWIYFAGNMADLDESVWVVRVNVDTGDIWYKNGKRLQLLQDAE